jgi:hypothetical protein
LQQPRASPSLVDYPLSAFSNGRLQRFGIERTQRPPQPGWLLLAEYRDLVEILHPALERVPIA